ncbi:MAG: sigma-70 family RNA polymerase sigma factor [Cyclobacteriaceae bacterium]|nr:sigma-70 family RNA polymerase sigma factor [Cyclobacteriaceae bacterium]
MKNIYGHLTLKEIFMRLANEPNRVLYEFFFKKYYPKLIWFAKLYVKQHSAAEEIVSNVLLNLFNRLSKIAESQNLEGYIFIAVKNQSLKYLRKSNRITYLENFDSDEDLLLTPPEMPENICIEGEFYKIVREAIDSLPPKRKTCFPNGQGRRAPIPGCR